MNGCATSAYSRGICYTHGRKPCTVEGCGKREVTFAANTAGAMGSARDCIAWGCNTNAHAGMKGLCKKHPKDKAACSTSGCSNGVVARRLCAKHGAFGFCSTDGCGSGAVCLFQNCNTAAHARGMCYRHGGGSSKVCAIEGCKTLARARGRCTKHGADGWCKVEGCTTPARKGFEHCIAHGGGKKKKPCSVAGCTTTSSARGLCGKHGGGKKKCAVDQVIAPCGLAVHPNGR